ncbi:hypothetical protein BD410DRAFT_772248 [Rickenella mellea]|uniref:Uncharacterized protein n=1 Tax=Rickenella mellea TaxID=50990 RepID=A0A4Y7Q1U8_9AGAM|nr:hypothetical protein BD410DRAFT_772248 [Rickenella mellea]
MTDRRPSASNRSPQAQTERSELRVAPSRTRTSRGRYRSHSQNSRDERRERGPVEVEPVVIPRPPSRKARVEAPSVEAPRLEYASDSSHFRERPPVDSAPRRSRNHDVIPDRLEAPRVEYASDSFGIREPRLADSAPRRARNYGHVIPDRFESSGGARGPPAVLDSTPLYARYDRPYGMNGSRSYDRRQEHYSEPYRRYSGSPPLSEFEVPWAPLGDAAPRQEGPYHYTPRPPKDSEGRSQRNEFAYFISQIPAQIYINLLLQIPNIYYKRVRRLFPGSDWSVVIIPVCEWGGFVDTVKNEWQTLNVVSGLTLTAVVSLLAISDIANGIVTRTAAQLSLIAALWSLMYGIIYVLRFSTMGSPQKAYRWAMEARNTRTNILWNVWVLLAMPAVWFAWSIISFSIAIITYVWTTGSSQDNPTPPSRHAVLPARIVLSVFFALGLVYAGLVIRTFSSYASVECAGDPEKVPPVSIPGDAPLPRYSRHHRYESYGDAAPAMRY